MAEMVGVEPTEAVNLKHLANARTRPLCDLSAILQKYYDINGLACQSFFCPSNVISYSAVLAANKAANQFADWLPCRYSCLTDC